MNIFSKILLLCMLIPALTLTRHEDIAAFKKLVASNAAAWRSIPNNVRYYIAAAITDNPNGTELYRIGLKEQLQEVANYKEFLDPQIYASHKAFWTGLNAIFSSETLQVDKLEIRLSHTNTEYLASLPKLQKKNVARLSKMITTTDQTRSGAGGRHSGPAKPGLINAQANTTALLRAAARNVCSLLKAKRKKEAKQKIIMLACLTKRIPQFWDAVLLDTVDIVFSKAAALSFNYALKAIATQTVDKLKPRMKGRTHYLRRAMNDYDDCMRTGLMTRFSATPIADELIRNNEPRAISLTIKLIKDICLEIQKAPPASTPKTEILLLDEEDPGIKHGGKFKVDVRPKSRPTPTARKP